jgi:putative endonuclease
MYYLYFLYSDSRQQFYIGVSADINKRLRQHNMGWSRSTKPYTPWKLVYSENFERKDQAYKREHFLKSPAGYLEKKKIIATIKL